jgi:hypothetical protein
LPAHSTSRCAVRSVWTHLLKNNPNYQNGCHRPCDNGTTEHHINTYRPAKAAQACHISAWSLVSMYAALPSVLHRALGATSTTRTLTKGFVTQITTIMPMSMTVLSCMLLPLGVCSYKQTLPLSLQHISTARHKQTRHRQQLVLVTQQKTEPYAAKQSYFQAACQAAASPLWGCLLQAICTLAHQAGTC